MAVLGLHCSAGFSLVEANGGHSLVVMCRLLLLWSMASREHGLQVQHRLSSCSF